MPVLVPVLVPVRVPAPLRRATAAAVLAAVALLAVAPAASAADGVIVDVERSGSGLQVTVEVPADVEVDLEGVTAAVDGEPYAATATRITDSTRVERTTVLAIDTSNSMRGAKFEAAKTAARTFIDAVPDDVLVGIVSFDSDVSVELEPTVDRADARAVIDDLTLNRETLLYDGVIAAVELTGDEGQRSVLVISDGEDTTDTRLPDVVEAVEESDGVVVDVVALGQTEEQLQVLDQIADGTGRVIEAEAEALAGIFSAEADVLERQVAVTVDVPAEVTADDFSLRVTLPSSAGDIVVDNTSLSIGEGADPSDPLGSIPGTAAPGTGGSPPDWLLYAGAGVFGAGLLAALVVLVPARPVAMTAAQRVTTYTSATYGPTAGDATPGPPPAPEVALTQQANEAIAGVLRRNRTLEDRIARRLEAAGSELRPSEWVLAHIGVFVAVSLVGLLLGRGGVVLGLIFMVLGAVGPWVYLGLRAERRRRAFDAALPETLQLMASSLSAGLSLMQSVDTIVREGSEPVASALRRVLVETRIGVSLEDAMAGVADRFDSRDFRWVVMAIKIQRQVGGNLAELLVTVADTMREREYVRRQVAALAAEGKLSAIVLAALPPLFLVYLLITRGDYIEPLFTDPRGLIMIVGAMLWLGVGVLWMSRLVKVEV